MIIGWFKKAYKFPDIHNERVKERSFFPKTQEQEKKA
jgi:hypothetical protein